MGYVYATINKDTLAHICKEKGVSSEFLASKTKLNMSRLNQWLTPTDINLPTINQAKKIAACLHIHELVHLFKRESSLCNDMSSSASTLSEEVFCNAVAGELLVPKRALRIVLEHGHYFAPYSIDDIKRVADRFSVSREVIVRRLLELRMISAY